MSYYQGNDLKKPSGGLKRPHRGKRRHEMGSPPTLTKLGDSDTRKIERAMGGNVKIRLKEAVFVNVAMPRENVVKKVKVLDVVETPANPQYARFKIISKGSIVKTELGLVRVTSRPGQHGVLNGVLIQKT